MKFLPESGRLEPTIPFAILTTLQQTSIHCQYNTR